MGVLGSPERVEAKSVPATPEDVNEQLREQLKLLQSGRRSSISLLPSSGNTTRASSVIGTKTPSCNSTPSFSRHPSHSSLEGDPNKSTDEQTVKSSTSASTSQQKPKFIDSLISKLKTQGLNLPAAINDDNQSLSAHSSPEKATPNPPPPHKPSIDRESSIDNAGDDDRLSDHSTSSADVFLGFKEDEAQFERPNIPGMLPTPVVRKSKGVKSAFISEELDNFMKENALDNNSYRTAPLKKRHDEAMMYAEAEPPSLLCPQLPSDVEKPRTVAEKRQLLERKADIKYLMIENESTVYRELRKRGKTSGPMPNYTLIRNIQEMNIPFTRDCWRATCWLNTPNGRFYYQTIRDNGKEVKVMGGRGNNIVKELVQLQPINKKKFTRQPCSKTCRLVANIKINGLDELITETTNQNAESSFTAKKLNTLADGYSFHKPGPLSLKKLNAIESSVDVELGPLELYSLPIIQLEVWPKLDRPLPEAVHPYLKLALPHEKITPEWAEFALSTLKQTAPPPSVNRRKRKRTTTESSVDANRSFTFDIPYTNNQSRIMVRKRRQMVPAKLAKLNSINENEKAELSFMKDVDRSDDVAVACADVLTGMIDSVALSLCEAAMVRDDPDIDYGRVDGQVDSGDGKSVGINAVDGKKKSTPAGKVVKELKKLNAKIIHGFDDAWVKKEECRNSHCRFGCICDSLRGAQTYSYHCKEVNCMFECKCPSSKIKTSTFESAVHNSDIKQYCDRLNASLAKEEKDFTATVVVSEGKTIYVPTWDEKKKRLKKVPKRLSDCVQFENDFVHRDLSETLLTKEENRQRAWKADKVSSERVDDPVLVSSKNDIVRSMIHVNVNVERLNQLDDLQPLCMIHGLYKCFCKFRAIDGRRFEFTNSKIDVIEQPVYTKKRQYTFERNKDEPANKYMAVVADDDSDYSLTCRRVRIVDTNYQKIKNRTRLEAKRREVKAIERDHPELKRLLVNRIRRCIALPEGGQLITVPDAYEDKSQMSRESHSIADMHRTSHESSRSADVKDSTTLSEANATKYRSRFNNIITKTMHGISHKLKVMTTLPSPINKAFYYMQWKHFISHFNADRIYVWNVQLNTSEVFLVVTDKNVNPIMSNAMCVMNIKALSTERLPLLPKLIKLGVENEETEKLSVLLFGISNYWRVLGCTHSKNDFMNNRVVAVPTPDTNPALASKISSLFDDMVKLTAQNRSKPGTRPSNICIRKLDTSNVDNIQLPIPVKEKHRWYFMLSLANDFSHIYVPEWKQFISHKKIMSAIEHAKSTEQTVRWGPSNLSPQVYVSHNSDMKLFFGPMVKNESLNLQLLQQHDGKMMPREEYQRMMEQKTNVNVTVGTWLYMKDDHKMTADAPKLRTYPPQSKITAMKPSTSTSLGFIRLKPATVASSNMNITLMSPTSTADGLSNFATSTPEASSSSNSNPSSELVRQLSLGLRTRPAKVPDKPSSETGSIKVVDTKLLMAPEFLGESSSACSSNQPIERPTHAKPITLSIAPKSNTDWKDVSKGVPIRGRRFTTFAPNNKPMLKRMLQQPMVKNPSTIVDKPLNVQPETNAMAKPLPPSIKSRRYTTIVSTGAQSLLVKNPLHSLRPPPVQNVQNFELVPNRGKKLTLAQMPAQSSLMLNRPVIIKKIETGDLVTLRRSKSIDRSSPLKHRPLSPSNKQSNVRPSTSIASSSAPVVVVKPKSLNLHVPAKVSAGSISVDGKMFVMKKVNNQPQPSIVRSVGQWPNRKLIKIESDASRYIDSDEELSMSAKPLANSSMLTDTKSTVNGYLISQVRGLGKIMAKKLFASYSLNLPGETKVFQTFKLCVDFLNRTYLMEKLFAMVPANLIIEWKFVSVASSSHVAYQPHDENTLQMSMVLTEDRLIDLNSDFHSNEELALELRHHLLVLRLGHACMKNSEARHKSGLDIVRRSETVIKGLRLEERKLDSCRRALKIQNVKLQKLIELKRRRIAMDASSGTSSSAKDLAKDEIITIDSDDDE